MTHLALCAEASAHIGTGHQMRCLALAQAAQRHGWTVALHARGCPPGIARRYAESGIPVRPTPPDPADVVFLDGYHWDDDAEREMRRARPDALLVAMDDHGHAGHGAADLVVNQNVGAEGLVYAAPDALLGPRYALVRDEFMADIPAAPRDPKRVLVTLGGGDPDNATGKVMDALRPVPGLEVDVVIGASNPHADVLRNACPPDWTIHQDVPMAPLLARAGQAVAAGGSTCWELCLYGVPPALITIADNQLAIVQGLTERGFAVDLGWHDAVRPDDIRAAVEQTVRDGTAQRMAIGQRLVDGQGADRVMQRISQKVLGNA